MQGTLGILIQPCSKSGSPLGDEFYIEEPAELLGHPYGIKARARFAGCLSATAAQITVKSADITKLRFTKGIKVQYQPHKQPNATVTPFVSGATPAFNHSQVFYYDKVGLTKQCHPSH